MVYSVEILVSTKESVLNPEAKVIEQAAKSLGYKLGKLNKGKYFSYISQMNSVEEAEKEARDISHKLFSNPIIEKYEIISIK